MKLDKRDQSGPLPREVENARLMTGGYKRLSSDLGRQIVRALTCIDHKLAFLGPPIIDEGEHAGSLADSHTEGTDAVDRTTGNCAPRLSRPGWFVIVDLGVVWCKCLEMPEPKVGTRWHTDRQQGELLHIKAGALARYRNAGGQQIVQSSTMAEKCRCSRLRSKNTSTTHCNHVSG